MVRLSSFSFDVGRAFGSGWLSVVRTTLDWSVRVLILFAWAINRDLNGDLATLDLFAVHVSAGLLLHLFTSEGNEAEAATLAWFVAGLKLADHELLDWAERDLGGGRGVVSEDFEKLGDESVY